MRPKLDDAPCASLSLSRDALHSPACRFRALRPCLALVFAPVWKFTAFLVQRDGEKERNEIKGNSLHVMVIHKKNTKQSEEKK
ncbi:hypothetical protein M406DRAFT_358486 [Cryphonectria parasitica EP155]|uniref:Uncharacterized protein n=1 Tax=Cryphonectria parasitica (strain ATCC 38755 / EP155) TaxID=660469 RepID=A0A9P5CKT7_CRYP1|nr:uncharacterized protein M406DRAFT_358486 [Cryphonectria parasitica EP155]KAF3761120.1 hypothetical protein M406DRAFT_358486 [Cryphonectria parasitica EP155]